MGVKSKTRKIRGISFAFANPLILKPSHQAYRRTGFHLHSQTLSFSNPLTKPGAGPEFKMPSQTVSFSNPLTKPGARPNLICIRKPSHSQSLSPSLSQDRILSAFANPLILNPSHQAYRRAEFILPSQSLSFSIPLTKPIAGPNLFCRRNPSHSQTLSPSLSQGPISSAFANRLILKSSQHARHRTGFQTRPGDPHV